MSDQERTDLPNVTEHPSQAEGDRQIIEEKLGEQPTQTNAETPTGAHTAETDKPSQAEGDRDVA